MKIQIEFNPNIEEEIVTIQCKELNNKIQKIQQSIMQVSNETNIVFYKDNVEYYIPIDNTLFFETSTNHIEAHTIDNVYKIKNKLYELEEILPNNFVRISKSTIINVNHIYSIERNLTSSSLVKFNKTHKQVYVFY